MARKFKREEIETHGIYEIRLHDREDGSFIEKGVIEVWECYPYGTLDYKDNDGFAPVESLEDEFIVYQRKIGELRFPFICNPEYLEEIKKLHPQYKEVTL